MLDNWYTVYIMEEEKHEMPASIHSPRNSNKAELALKHTELKNGVAFQFEFSSARLLRSVFIDTDWSVTSSPLGRHSHAPETNGIHHVTV